MKTTAASIGAVLLVMLASSARAQYFSFGSCPVLTPLTPVNPVLIARRWFEYSRTPSIIEHGLRCVTGSVTFNNAFAIRYTARQKISDIRLNLNGNAVFASGNNVGTLAVTFSNPSIPLSRSKSFVFTIIGMDGSVMGNNVIAPTFMTLYTCRSFGIVRLETSYILTTQRIPAPATVSAAQNTLIARNLPVDSLRTVDQTNC